MLPINQQSPKLGIFLNYYRMIDFTNRRHYHLLRSKDFADLLKNDSNIVI